MLPPIPLEAADDRLPMQSAAHPRPCAREERPHDWAFLQGEEIHVSRLDPVTLSVGRFQKVTMLG